MKSYEFKERFENNDVVCVVAQALSNRDSVFHTSDLLNAKDFIIMKYINKAEKIIKLLEEYNLEIKYKNEEKN